jgi:hypothetical protein
MAGNLVIKGHAGGHLVEAIAYNDGVNGFTAATVAVDGRTAIAKVTYEDDDEGEDRRRRRRSRRR